MSDESILPTEDEYTGYKEIKMTEEEMGLFYTNLNKNTYNLSNHIVGFFQQIKGSETHYLNIILICGYLFL